VKIVLLRFAFAAALSISLGFVCRVAHAQSQADLRVADTASANAAAPAAALPQSFPPTDAPLFTPTTLDHFSLVSSSFSASDPGDLTAYSPKASAAEAVPSCAAWPAASTPEPKPSPYYEQFPRKWELGLAFALVRFRSSIYYASAPGLNSSLTYWWKDRIAFEGSVTSAFAPPVFANEHFRYLGYGAGPKFSFGSGRLEPWAHALVGGVHLIPQTASSGKNGFEVTMGGGVDYAINDVISAKGGVDYLGTHMFGEWQSSLQIVAGLSLRF
jgi:hypothetical protein